MHKIISATRGVTIYIHLTKPDMICNSTWKIKAQNDRILKMLSQGNKMIY